MNLSVSGQGISAEPQTRVARESRVNCCSTRSTGGDGPAREGRGSPAAAAAVDAEIANAVVDPVCQAAFDGDVTALSALLSGGLADS